jgi:Domain of unknown function (DUF4350)
MTGRNRAWVLIILGLLVATAVSAWVTSGNVKYPGSLDPQNPRTTGAQALAQVLGDQGVDVEIVRSADSLEAASVSGATILVTSTEQLGASTAQRLVEHAGSADLVVVQPGPDLVELLGYDGLPVTVQPDGAVSAQCADARLSGLQIEVEFADSYPPVDAGCFPEEDGVLYAPQDDRVAFLGAGDLLSNDQITRADNAAVALRLLGRQDHLVWYVPDLSDLRAGDEVGIGALLPRWLEPALWLGGLVLLALVIWRGRRLGPLVTEPLPVVVKAIETTQSRGRLYRKVRDRSHAAGALRAAARTRAAERLRLPRNLDERSLMQEVSRHTGRSLDEVYVVLSDMGSTAATDKDLSILAGRLAELDDQLRKAPR